MKKQVIIIATLFVATTCNLNAQQKTIIKDPPKCNGYWNETKLDCTASSGVCCLPDVVVTPKIDLKILADDIKNQNDNAIRTKMDRIHFPPQIIDIWDGLKKGTFVLRAAVLTSKDKLHVFIERVTSNSRKHDYVGHVTLLR